MYTLWMREKLYINHQKYNYETEGVKMYLVDFLPNSNNYRRRIWMSSHAQGYIMVQFIPTKLWFLNENLNHLIIVTVPYNLKNNKYFNQSLSGLISITFIVRSFNKLFLFQFLLIMSNFVSEFWVILSYMLNNCVNQCEV